MPENIKQPPDQCLKPPSHANRNLQTSSSHVFAGASTHDMLMSPGSSDSCGVMHSLEPVWSPWGMRYESKSNSLSVDKQIEKTFCSG